MCTKYSPAKVERLRVLLALRVSKGYVLWGHTIEHQEEVLAPERYAASGTITRDWRFIDASGVPGVFDTEEEAQEVGLVGQSMGWRARVVQRAALSQAVHNYDRIWFYRADSARAPECAEHYIISSFAFQICDKFVESRLRDRKSLSLLMS